MNTIILILWLSILLILLFLLIGGIATNIYYAYLDDKKNKKYLKKHFTINVIWKENDKN